MPPEQEALTAALAVFASVIAERRPALTDARRHPCPQAARCSNPECRGRRSPDPGEHDGGGPVIEGQRCLVTGGGGTIGSTIVDQLVEAGASEVIVLDNFVRGVPRTWPAFSPRARWRSSTETSGYRRQVTEVMVGDRPGLPSGGHTDHAMRGGAPARPRGPRRRHRRSRRGRGERSVRKVVVVCRPRCTACHAVPDIGAAPPVRVLTPSTARPRPSTRPAPQLLRNAWPRLRGPA